MARGALLQVQRKCSTSHTVYRRCSKCSRAVTCSAEKKATEPGQTSDLKLKAAWYGAELLGKIAGGAKQAGAPSAPLDPIAWEKTLAEIRSDFDKNYFVNGDAEMAAYDPQCLFADPFTSFRGVDRFKQNLANFSKFTSDVKCDVTSWEEMGEHKLKVGWRFSCILSLPWKPILAAAGSTTYVGDPATGRVVEHIEAWDAEPEKVLKRLLKPSNKAAGESGTAIEQFMDGVSKGDYRKAWLNSAGALGLVLLPDAVLASGAGYVWQEGGVGAFLWALQAFLWSVCAVCAVTEVVRRIQKSQKEPM